MHSAPPDPSRNDPVFVEIVEALETIGLNRYDYRLDDAVDVEALERVLESATGDVEVSSVIDVLGV